MPSGAEGYGKKCHEVSYESYFKLFGTHMPSLTESAGKVMSMKLARLVSSGTSGTRGRSPK